MVRLSSFDAVDVGERSGAFSRSNLGQMRVCCVQSCDLSLGHSRVNSLEVHRRQSFVLNERVRHWTFDADCRGKSNARCDGALSDIVNSSVF